MITLDRDIRNSSKYDDLSNNGNLSDALSYFNKPYEFMGYVLTIGDICLFFFCHKKFFYWGALCVLCYGVSICDTCLGCWSLFLFISCRFFSSR